MANIVDLFDVEGGPGRSRIQRPPSSRTRDRIERHRQAVAEHEDADPLVRASRASGKIDALYIARQEIAVEAASLLWERYHTRPGSRELGRICSRRVAALMEVASMTVNITRADPGAPSVAVAERVCDLLRMEVEAAAAEVLPGGRVERFTQALRRRLDAGGLRQVISAP